MKYERYRDWYEEAIDDLEVARELLKLGRYSKVCYFCHQACEKVLKALMIKKLGRYRPTHSVAELFKELSKAMNIPLQLVRKGERLDRYYIPTRYLNAWPSGPPHKHYDEEDAKEALSYAEEVVLFAEKKLRNYTQESDMYSLVGKLKKLVKELVEEYKPVAIILAGSLAQKKFVQGLSDVDILVVTESNIPKGKRFTLKVVEEVDVEITAISLDELAKAVKGRNQFYCNALLHGVKIYGKLPQHIYELAKCTSNK